MTKPLVAPPEQPPFYVPEAMRHMVDGVLVLLWRAGWPEYDDSKEGRAYREDCWRFCMWLLEPTTTSIQYVCRVICPLVKDGTMDAERAWYLLGFTNIDGEVVSDERLRIEAGV
jgi:hypothetical protein